MSHIIITIVAVLAIAQISLQASVSKNEPLTYSVTNLSPDDAQMIDLVKISNLNKLTLEKTTSPVSVLNSPRIDVTSWPNYAVGHVNLTSSYLHIDSTICLYSPFFCCKFNMHLQNFTAGANSRHYEYRFGIFQGWNNNTTPPPMLCSVFRCASIDIKDCNRDIFIDTDVVFDNITIIANTTKEHKYLLERSSYKANMSPFPESEYEWHEYEENDFYGVRYVLNTTAANLYSFSINGTGNNSDFSDFYSGRYVRDTSAVNINSFAINGTGNNTGGPGVPGRPGGNGDAAGLAVSMFIMFSIFLFNILLV